MTELTQAVRRLMAARTFFGGLLVCFVLIPVLSWSCLCFGLTVITLHRIVTLPPIL